MMAIAFSLIVPLLVLLSSLIYAQVLWLARGIQ